MSPTVGAERFKAELAKAFPGIRGDQRRAIVSLARRAFSPKEDDTYPFITDEEKLK